MATIPPPDGMSFSKWSASVGQSLPNYNVPAAVSESHWKKWAAKLGQAMQVSLPSPHSIRYHGRNGWRLWAQVTAQTLSQY